MIAHLHQVLRISGNLSNNDCRLFISLLVSILIDWKMTVHALSPSHNWLSSFLRSSVVWIFFLFLSMMIWLAISLDFESVKSQYLQKISCSFSSLYVLMMLYALFGLLWSNLRVGFSFDRKSARGVFEVIHIDS